MIPGLNRRSLVGTLRRMVPTKIRDFVNEYGSGSEVPT